MNRLLVTGASGFIGRAAIAAFTADGYEVRAAVRRLPESPLSGGIEIVQHADLSQPVDWRPLVEGVNAIIHLAGLAHTGGAPSELYDCINRKATADLALTAAKAGVKRFVFVSSVRAQTGASADHVIIEQDPALPTDAYGRSKLAAEASVQAAGLPFTILRPVVVYGPGVKGNLRWLLRAAGSPFPLPLKGFANRRSLLGIDNFLAALRFVLASRTAAGETYLVADPGIAPTMGEIVAAVRRADNRPSGLIHVPPGCIKVLLYILQKHDLWKVIAGQLQVNPAKLIAAGWRPTHDSLAGLATMAQDNLGGASLHLPSTAPPNTPTLNT